MSFKILVPTDHSVYARPAIALAATWARALEGSLDLLHVVDVRMLAEMPVPDKVDPLKEREQLLAQANEALAQAQAEHAGQLEVRAHTRAGLPWDEIHQASNLLNVDLTVMTTHGRSGLSQLFMGSVAERVLRTAVNPLLTLRSGTEPESLEQAQQHTRQLPKQLLVAADLSHGTLRVLELAGRLADRFDAQVTLVHVLDMSYTSLALLNAKPSEDNFQQRLIQTASDTLRAYLEAHRDTLSPRILSAPLMLRIGEAAVELLSASDEANADLVILGRHTYSGLRRLLMGSTAEQVVRASDVPVLVVPLLLNDEEEAV